MKLIKTVVVLSVAFAASSVFALPKGFQANPTGASTNSIQAEGVKHIGITLETKAIIKVKLQFLSVIPRLFHQIPRKDLPITSPSLLPKSMKRQINSLSKRSLTAFWVKTKTTLPLPTFIR